MSNDVGFLDMAGSSSGRGHRAGVAFVQQSVHEFLNTYVGFCQLYALRVMQRSYSTLGSRGGLQSVLNAPDKDPGI
jgi:hypothetical protein